MMTASRQNRLIHLLTYVFTLAAVLITPWILFLDYTLPSHTIVDHWRITWVSFDILLSILLLATALAAIKDYHWLVSLAPATAALLLCDAWFDILTAHHVADFHMALITAIFGEIPLAILCIVATIIGQNKLSKQNP